MSPRGLSLDTVRNYLRRLSAERRSRDQSLQAAARNRGGCYVLMDVAGAHFSTGAGFRPVQWGFRADVVLCFETEEAAREEQHRQRKRGCHLRVRRMPASAAEDLATNH